MTGNHHGEPNAPERAQPKRRPAELLATARAGLEDAVDAKADSERYAAAHNAALRAATAVLAARPVPERRQRQAPTTSVWALLPLVAPELADWAGFFGDSAQRRAEAEAGTRVVSAGDAERMVAAVGTFIDVVEGLIA